MKLDWIHESVSKWDEPKSAIVGGAPEGIFEPVPHEVGELLPGDWWRVEGDGKVVGYAWMDCTWGEGEVLLAVDAAAEGHGVGTFILDRLEHEATSRGLNYLYNVVRSTHPKREKTTAWLRKRRFEPGHDGDRLIRRIQRAPSTS